MQLDPIIHGPISGHGNWGTGALNVCSILRYLGVLWEGISLHIFNGFGSIQQYPIKIGVNVMDVWMFDFTLNQ